MKYEGHTKKELLGEIEHLEERIQMLESIIENQQHEFLELSESFEECLESNSDAVAKNSELLALLDRTAGTAPTSLN